MLKIRNDAQTFERTSLSGRIKIDEQSRNEISDNEVVSIPT